MSISRRGFLGLLFGASMAGMAKASGVSDLVKVETTQKNKNNRDTVSQKLDENILWEAYCPTLKLNEGEVLHFYRCSRGLIHVGYGSNIQENPSLLNGIKVIHQGKLLSEKEKNIFLKQSPQKSKKDLEGYSISRQSALEIAKKHTFKFISLLAQNFPVDKVTQKSAFFSLPLCMQALALDVFYNVGPERFKKYKKFQAALKNQDFQTAVQESQVSVSKKGEKIRVNKGRERRKGRNLDIFQVVRSNRQASPEEIKLLIKENYISRTPNSVRVFNQKYDLPCEQALACGELKHLQLYERRNLVLQKDMQMQSHRATV